MKADTINPEEVGIWDVNKINYYINSNKERGNTERVSQLESLKSQIK